MHVKRTIVVVAVVALGTCLVGAVAKPTGDAEEILCENGLVLADKDIKVGARLDGEISEILVKEGQEVKKGDVLAKLEDTLAKLDVARSRLEAENNSAVEAAKRQAEVYDFEHDVNVELQKKGKGFVSQTEFKKTLAQKLLGHVQITNAKQQQEVAKKALEIAQARLDDHRILSPIDGIIAEKIKDVGEPVQDREPVFRILNIKKVLVEGWLDIRYLRDVHQGQRVKVRLVIEPGQAYPGGKIVFVDPQVQAGSSMFRVKAEVPNPDGRIRPGLKATMTITTTSG